MSVRESLSTTPYPESGLYTFAYKLGISVSVFIGGILLDMIGFVSEAKEQTAETAYQLAIAPTRLLMVATPVILWAVMGYRIDRNKHVQTLSRLGAKSGPD